MRIRQERFSLPWCILDEPMPSKALNLLMFLFRESDFEGLSRPGYAAMQKAVRDDPRENGSKTTVRAHLKYLEERGWIFHMKKTNGRMAIWLQIPPRLRPSKKEQVKRISVVQ